MLRSMLCLGQDENGYPPEGIDLVPERPKPREPLNELITLLEERNEQVTQLKQQADLVKLLQQANRPFRNSSGNWGELGRVSNFN